MAGGCAWGALSCHKGTSSCSFPATGSERPHRCGTGPSSELPAGATRRPIRRGVHPARAQAPGPSGGWGRGCWAGRALTRAAVSLRTSHGSGPRPRGGGRRTDTHVSARQLLAGCLLGEQTLSVRLKPALVSGAQAAGGLDGPRGSAWTPWASHLCLSGGRGVRHRDRRDPEVSLACAQGTATRPAPCRGWAGALVSGAESWGPSPVRASVARVQWGPPLLSPDTGY